jgi:hypothetical protein
MYGFLCSRVVYIWADRARQQLDDWCKDGIVTTDKDGSRESEFSVLISSSSGLTLPSSKSYMFFGISDRNENRNWDAYTLGDTVEASWEL